MNVLEIKELYKSFGNEEVLKGLNINVLEHSIFGLVGQNGAGKTTTMKIITGLSKANSGTVLVCGEKVTYGSMKTNKYIGYLSDVSKFYGYMRPLEYLQLCGEITGLSKKEACEKGRELLFLVGLNDNNKKIRTFSRGMKQRLGIAQALINDPKLLILDEPTSALDPIGRRQILDILISLKGKTTVIFSTHILSDVEEICDYVAFLHNGSIVLAGTIWELKEKYDLCGYKIEFVNEKDINRISNLLKKETYKFEQKGNILNIVVNDYEKDGKFLIDLLAKQLVVPIKFARLKPSLETLFKEVVL